MYRVTAITAETKRARKRVEVDVDLTYSIFTSLRKIEREQEKSVRFRLVGVAPLWDAVKRVEVDRTSIFINSVRSKERSDRFRELYIPSSFSITEYNID